MRLAILTHLYCNGSITEPPIELEQDYNQFKTVSNDIAYSVDRYEEVDLLNDYLAFRNYVIFLARICGGIVNATEFKNHVTCNAIVEALYMKYDQAILIFNTVAEHCFTMLDGNMILLDKYK